jgi:hypothetical protein
MDKPQLTIRKTDRIMQVIAQARREKMTVAEFIYKLYHFYMYSTCGEKEAINVDRD